jgi:hypothetical protein
MRRLSWIISSSEEEQDEIILKSSREAVWPLASRCWRMLVNFGFLLLLPVRAEIPKCSDTRVRKWRTVWPTYDAEQHRHLKWYTTQDLRPLGILSLKVRRWERRRVGRKTNLIFKWGNAEEQSREIWVRICRECKPVNGRQKYVTFLGTEWTTALGWKTLSKKTRTHRSNKRVG